jgi:hypothetical protein
MNDPILFIFVYLLVWHCCEKHIFVLSHQTEVQIGFVEDFCETKFFQRILQIDWRTDFETRYSDVDYFILNNKKTKKNIRNGSAKMLKQ